MTRTSLKKAVNVGRGGLVWFEFSDAAHAGKTCVGVYRRRRAWKEKLPGKRAVSHID
jgi:hypothetical protein